MLSEKVLLNESIDIFIVGNQLKNFASHGCVYTYGDFCNYLELLVLKTMDKGQCYRLHLSQGLSVEEIDEIRKKIEFPNCSGRFICVNLSSHQRAPSRLTHKRDFKNTLISEPYEISEMNYKSCLTFDAACADLSDHITGQHVPGMLMLEAARQMVNAVSEKYLIPEKVKSSKGFVLNSITSDFGTYIFPFDTELHCVITKLRWGLVGDFVACAEILLKQNDNVSVKMKICFSAMNNKSLLSLESQRAKAALNKFIEASEGACINAR